MQKLLLLLCILFFHIVDDYYLQGILASMKQKRWWETSCELYKYDYIMALIEHAFSWTFMVHIPVVVYEYLRNIEIPLSVFIITFAFNWIVHAFTDNAKANLKQISLVQDQIIHIVQVIGLWIVYAGVV